MSGIVNLTVCLYDRYLPRKHRERRRFVRRQANNHDQLWYSTLLLSNFQILIVYWNGIVICYMLDNHFTKYSKWYSSFSVFTLYPLKLTSLKRHINKFCQHNTIPFCLKPINCCQKKVFKSAFLRLACLFRSNKKNSMRRKANPPLPYSNSEQYSTDQLLTLNISCINIQFKLPHKITREVWERIRQFWDFVWTDGEGSCHPPETFVC